MSTDALFQKKEIRKSLHLNEWWFVISDVVAALTDSTNPSDYLKKLRSRDPSLAEVFKGGGQLVPPLALEFETAGGKQRLQCWNTEGIFRLIQSIPSPKAEPFKRWLARVGYERLEEIENPELAAKRMRAIYEQKGYSEDWIEKRLRGIAVRDELTDEWKKRGVKEQKEFAILTAEFSPHWEQIHSIVAPGRINLAWPKPYPEPDRPRCNPALCAAVPAALRNLLASVPKARMHDPATQRALRRTSPRVPPSNAIPPHQQYCQTQPQSHREFPNSNSLVVNLASSPDHRKAQWGRPLDAGRMRLESGRQTLQTNSFNGAATIVLRNGSAVVRGHRSSFIHLIEHFGNQDGIVENSVRHHRIEQRLHAREETLVFTAAENTWCPKNRDMMGRCKRPAPSFVDETPSCKKMSQRYRFHLAPAKLSRAYGKAGKILRPRQKPLSFGELILSLPRIPPAYPILNQFFHNRRRHPNLRRYMPQQIQSPYGREGYESRGVCAGEHYLEDTPCSNGFNKKFFYFK